MKEFASRGRIRKNARPAARTRRRTLILKRWGSEFYN